LYYDHVRAEIAPLLPPKATRILDVGCGEGWTLSWVGDRYPAARTIGVEYNAELKERLSQNCDEPHIMDLSRSTPDVRDIDLLLCLDVLEHLPDPVDALRRLSGLLRPDATVIVSLPNVAHFSVSLPLLLFGRFRYQSAGILDRTHLRFFVAESAVQLVRDAGLQVRHLRLAGFGGRKTHWLNRLTLGLFRLRLARQLVISASLLDGSPDDAAQTWRSLSAPTLGASSTASMAR
jgi:2-polyprenyl-3-methyl-5-hydroxy-6-metoxy-1,4-benzoquinol methylase